MAKCTAPAMSAETRGRIGGFVYNTWRGIRCIKIKTGPAQPRTTRQLAIRSIAIAIIRAWADLLSTVQDQWREYARTHTTTDWTNTPVRATGANWYLACNTRLVDAGLAPITQPPSIAAPIPVTNFSAVGGAGTIVFEWTSPDNADLYVEVWKQGPYSKGSIGSLRKAKLANRVTSSDLTWTNSGLPEGHYQAWARVMDTATGLVSTWVSATANVT